MAMTGEARLLRIAGDDAVYEVPLFADISKDLIEKTAEQNPARTLVFRAGKPDVGDLGILADSIPPAWFCNIGFTADPLVCGKPRFPLTRGVALRPPASQMELESVLARTYQVGDLASSRSYVGDRWAKESSRRLYSMAAIHNTAFVAHGDKVVASVITFPHEDCLGTPMTLIGWIWVDKELSLESRQEVHGLLFQHLVNRGPGPFQAAVQLDNIRSQRFFAKYRFVPRCVHLRRKQS